MNLHRPLAPEPDWSLEEEVELFEMANLYPRDTGLPMTIWVSPRGMAQHDARVKVCRHHGDRMDPRDTASVAVRPAPHLVAGELGSSDLKLVSQWIAQNSDVLIGYWDGGVSTLELVRALKSL